MKQGDRSSRREVVLAAALTAGVALLPDAAEAQASVASRADAAIRRAAAFLRSRQQTDGSWGSYPGVTSVCVIGLVRAGIPGSDPSVVKACRYLASLAQPDGGIYTDKFGPGQKLPNYNTALGLTALHLANRAGYTDQIRKAQSYLVGSQYDEAEGFSPKDAQYGGIGYGSKQDNPDLSNLQNALEALVESGHSRNSEVFKKALVFVQRCQNRKESNDQRWAGADGGFVYAASGESKAEAVTRKANSSYGSMTYAGLKSYLYCGVSRTDPRVVAAMDWLKGHYDVESNPAMGSDGLYYYYHTMSKTLATWGSRDFTDVDGKKHRWASDLTLAVLKRQSADGSWKNENPRWWEDRPELATGYALMSLAYARKSL